MTTGQKKKKAAKLLDGFWFTVNQHTLQIINIITVWLAVKTFKIQILRFDLQSPESFWRCDDWTAIKTHSDGKLYFLCSNLGLYCEFLHLII